MGFCDTLKLLPVSGKLCSDEVVCSGTSNYLMFENSGFFNPSNAKVTFVQSTKMQRFFENHLNPVLLVFFR